MRVTTLDMLDVEREDRDLPMVFDECCDLIAALAMEV